MCSDWSRMTGLDAIFGELEADRFGEFREYIEAILPETGACLLVPDKGADRWGGLELDPGQEGDLMEEARAAVGKIVTRELGPGRVHGIYAEKAGGCLFYRAKASDQELVRAFIYQLVRGFSDHLNAREQESLIRTRKRQFAREKQILVTRNREILNQNYTQYEKYARMLESEIERQTKDLVAARKSAEAASKSKSEFLANMSHEIRTPMNGVIGRLEILSGTRLTRDQQSHVEAIRQSAHSLLTILNDILDFSKVEAGKLDIEQINFNLAATLDSVLDLMAPRAREKGIELAMGVDRDVPLHLIGDPSRVRQILVNLVGNAVKFTRKGHVFIRVFCSENRRRSCRLRFEVRDTGIGIPKDKTAGLFTLFSQVDSSTTRRFGGTGLGLAISRQLSQLMGGDIGVDSEQGKGSCFWFTIRVKKESEGLKISRFPEIPSLRVLVAGGSRVHQEVVLAGLEELGCRPVAAADAAAALDALETAQKASAPFDIVLADQDLSGMPGSRLCMEMMKRFRETTPILVLPEHLPGTRAKYRSCASYFLFKPLKKKDLFLSLRLAAKVPAVAEKDRIELTGPSPSSQTAAAGSPESGRPLTILLAEDNPVNQRVATLMLESAGHRIIPARDGWETLKMFQSGGFDLILMDIQMPVMDGEAACRKIREMERDSGTRIPIVALTANAMKGDRDRYLSAGMDDYLAKPIQKESLLRTVRNLTS